MKETELASKVVNWLTEQHWEVYQEVQFRGIGGIADIVAVRAGYLWIIECKTTLTLTVLRQASHWYAHFRSVAVPAGTNHDDRHFAYNLSRQYFRLGVLEYRSGNGVVEREDAPVMREYHKLAKGLIGQLCEEHKTHLAAGSNGGGYYTPYRRTMDEVKRFILANPGCALKQIMEHIGKRHHYASNVSARTSIRVALANWETWCEIKEGPKGESLYFVKGAKYG